MKHNVLLIDDDATLRSAMKGFLEDEGFFVKAVSSGVEGIAHIHQKIIQFLLCLVDYHLAGEVGSDVVREIRELNSDLPLLGFSGDDSDKAHNETLESGANTFVSKTAGNMKLLGILHRTCREVERRIKVQGVLPLNEKRKLIEGLGIAGASQHLADIALLIQKIAPSSSTVFIQGENGTGKERIARALHDHSPRRLGPFVAVNCGAIPENLIESELFGHERGSFTGASNAQTGKFRAANGGTIFLDEIGEMPLSAQVALLRVLQEKEVVAVGSNQPKKIDVRVIAATNAPIKMMIEQKTFREDLYFRLNALPLRLAPLRERPEDIPYLISHFLEKINVTSGKKKSITESCVRKLQQKPWPGNIRELQNEIERMHLLSDSDLIDGLKPFEAKSSETDKSDEKLSLLDHEILKQKQTEEEANLISCALTQASDMSETARLLGVTRSTLRSRMKALKIYNPFSEEEK